MKTEILNNNLIPNDVVSLISILTHNNKTAYIVGGCVRDIILGEEPHDYDICTELLPEETMGLLREYNIPFYKSGIEFGTITAQLNGGEYEITTYRKETGYKDSRHPDEVIYVNDIHEDLKRRDFTINAMAYNPLNNELIDDFNGLDDLHNGIIRSVGEANERFNEDALRILRALRFSIRFQCNIEEETYDAMKSNVSLLDNVSKERITAEFEKMLTCEKPVRKAFLHCDWLIGQVIPEMRACFGFKQNNKYHKHDVYEHTLAVVDNCETDKFEIKMAALLHDIGKPDTYIEDEDGWGHFYGHPEISYEISQELLRKNFRLTVEQTNRILELVRYHDMEIASTKSSVKRALNKHGVDFMQDWFILKQADMSDHIFSNNNKNIIDIPRVKEIMQSVIDDDACFKIKDLNINGNDIMKLLDIKPCKLIGELLQTLLVEVIDEKLINNYEKLKERTLELWSEKNGKESINSR